MQSVSDCENYNLQEYLIVQETFILSAVNVLVIMKYN
jgi:hypothetical protein